MYIVNPQLRACCLSVSQQRLVRIGEFVLWFGACFARQYVVWRGCRSHLWVATVGLLCSSGCTDPVFETPVGNVLAEKDTDMLLGEWQCGKSVANVATGKEGLIIGMLRFDAERCEFVAVNKRLVIANVGGNRIGFLKLPDSEHFTVLLLDEISKDKIKGRRASSEHFISLVKSGKLSGKLSERKGAFDVTPQVILKSDIAAFEAVLESETLERLFPSTKSVTFFRDRAPEGPGLEL